MPTHEISTDNFSFGLDIQKDDLHYLWHDLSSGKTGGGVIRGPTRSYTIYLEKDKTPGLDNIVVHVEPVLVPATGEIQTRFEIPVHEDIEKRVHEIMISHLDKIIQPRPARPGRPGMMHCILDRLCHPFGHR